jgi:hypothetical protein
MKKYQLVLQFRATSIEDFDRLIAFETTLLDRLPPLGKVDGHDFGEDEFNIFVLTDRPVEAFDAAEVLRRKELFEYSPVVAYREWLGEDYIVLSPAGYEGFTIS